MNLRRNHIDRNRLNPDATVHREGTAKLRENWVYRLPSWRSTLSPASRGMASQARSK
jgi:hypothetical protein